MKDLENKINIWTQILSNEDALKHVMAKELDIIKKQYATPRRTEIRDQITEVKIDMKEMIPVVKSSVVLTNEGYIKRLSTKYVNLEDTPTLKPGDYIKSIYI